MQPRIFSYILRHDVGFAPNPYAGILTLATCKPKIRATAKPGDWLLGTGSVNAVGAGRVVYAALVSGVMPIEQYDTDPRFRIKYPVKGQEPWMRHGDNIYSPRSDGTWRQRRNSHHFEKDISRDISGKNVLTCEKFWYFGRNAPPLPESLRDLPMKSQGHRCEDSPVLMEKLVSWLETFTPGISGTPYMESQFPLESSSRANDCGVPGKTNPGMESQSLPESRKRGASCGTPTKTHPES